MFFYYRGLLQDDCSFRVFHLLKNLIESSWERESGEENLHGIFMVQSKCHKIFRKCLLKFSYLEYSKEIAFPPDIPLVR